MGKRLMNKCGELAAVTVLIAVCAAAGNDNYLPAEKNVQVKVKVI